MKKLLFLVLLGVVSCGGSSKEKLNLGIWTDNIPQDIYNDFTKETGIKICQIPYSSNEEIYAKVKVNPTDYDMIVPSLDYAEIMLKEGLIEKFDLAAMPNITNLDEALISEVKEVDPTSEYLVPFAFGPTVIAYDHTKITNEVKDFSIYLNPEYKGRMMMMDNMREVVGPALKTLGYKINSTNAKELAAAQDLIRQWKANILRFDVDSYQNTYANEEVDLVHGYPETILVQLSPAKRSNTTFVIPNHGMMFVDSFVLVKGSQKQEQAQKFIDFIHRPDIYTRLMDYLGILSINKTARETISEEPVVRYEDLKKTTPLRAMKDEELAIQSRVWENILAD
ncbi:MAG: extracellular solute-binding protein [Brevinema sp.]